MKLRYKLMLGMAVLMLVTLGVYIVASTMYVQEELFEITLQTMNSTVRANAEKLSSSLRQMSLQLIMLTNSTELREGLKNYDDKDLVNKWESWREIYQLFETWSHYSPYSQVLLHLRESTLFFRNAPYYGQDTDAIDAYALHMTDYGSQRWHIDPEKEICSCFMPLVLDSENLGYVELGIDISWFMTGTANTEHSELTTFIADNQGNVLTGSCAGERLEQDSLRHIDRVDEKDIQAVAAANQPLRLYQEVEATPLYVVCEVDGAALNANGVRITSRLMVIGAMILVVALFLALEMSRLITRKLTILTREMERIKSGNLEMSTDLVVRDELDQTLYDFAVMAQQLQKMMNDVRVAEQKRKESELHLLQAQINPHFMANALSCLESMALNHDVQKLQQLVQSLSNYLRLSLHKSWQASTLERELDLIHNYWRIQQVRFGDKLCLNVRVPPGLLPAQIPPLVIQTLVENAMMHAFRPDVQKAFCVEIRIDLVDDVLLVEVEDNGCGMDAERLEEVRNALTDDQVATCYGLWNVHQRITERYGPAWGLSVESVEGAGTLCILTMPLSM